MRLKVGVLTFHRCINYGSYWQARCLVEGLRARGHDAVLLDHYSRKVNIAEWKCALQPVLPTPVPPSDHRLYREKMEKFFAAFEHLPLSAKFDLDEPSQMDAFDVVVVGSDEVWNLFHPWYGNNELFYGNGLKAEKLVSYAASFGNYPAAWGLEDKWANKLRNFSTISVRDENAQWLVKNATGVWPDQVLDPCLQFPLEPDQRFSHYEEPYAAVYGHNFSESFIKEIRRWAKEKQLPLISIGYRNDWADTQWLTADPHDFAHFIKHASVLATNFFHGCVYSLRYQKPFACETSPYRHNKLHGLMSQVGGEKHLVNDDSTSNDYDNILSQPLDESIIHRIEMLRLSSNAFLNRAFDDIQIQAA